MGWATITNSDLLVLAEGQFDAFVTVDRNLAFQQDLPRLSIAVIVLRARRNRLVDLCSLVPELLEALHQAARGQVTWIGT